MEPSGIRDLPNSTEWLSKSEAITLLQDKNITSKFFTNGVVAITDLWFPYKITSENMHIVAQTVQMLITRDVGGEVTALSFGDVMPNPIGNIYNLFFHGKSTMHVLCHLHKHLKHLQCIRNRQKDSYLFLHLPMSITVRCKDEILNNLSRFLNLIESEIICVYSVNLPRYLNASKL